MPVNRWQEFRNNLLEQVNFVEVYKDCGLVFSKAIPDVKGWLPAYSHEKFGGTDQSPSAAINVTNGIYKDFRANLTLSIFDFLVKVGIADNWREAQKYIADRYNFKCPSISKNHPEYGVSWRDWKDVLVQKFCQLRPPITVAGLKHAGAQLCLWHDQPAIALGIYDKNLHVIGYCYIPRSNKTFRGVGAKCIAKLYPGTEAGLIGLPTVRGLLSDRHPTRQAEIATVGQPDGEQYKPLLWVEGPTDLLAAYSLWPDSYFITNPHGCTENVTQTQISIFEYSPVRLCFVADCDVPGIVGAHKKQQQLEKMWTNRPGKGYGGSVLCPYTQDAIAEKHGKDLRDFISENFDDLQTAAITMVGPTIKIGQHSFHTIEDPKQLEQIEEKKDEQTKQLLETVTTNVNTIMKKLHLKILMVYEDGSFVFGSEATNKSKHLRSLRNFSYPDLLLVGGFDINTFVSDTNELNGPQIITFKDFLKILSLAVSLIPPTEKTIGEGIWAIDNENDNNFEIAVVKQGSFYILEQTKLTAKKESVYKNCLVDYTDKTNWFNFDKLQDYLTLTQNTSWRIETHKKLQSLIASWNWSYENMDLVACGLVYATWLQTIWQWRPIVTLTGESDSGKTIFLNFLHELYLNLAVTVANSTTAGIMQNIKNRAAPLLLDEFDASREQQKLFKTLRACGRNQKFLKGQTTQESRIYKLHHIPWISGIFYSTADQADLNRMITLHLLAANGKQFFTSPSQSELFDLGHRILAASLFTAKQSYKTSLELSRMGVSSRYRESYSIPFSTLSAMANFSIEDTNILLEDYLTNFVEKEITQEDTKNDQEAVLIDILNSTIRLPYDAEVNEPTVAMMLTRPDLYAMYWSYLEPKGLGVKTARSGLKHFVILPKTLTNPNGILAKTKWEYNLGLGQILRRLEGPIKPDSAVSRLAGQAFRCLRIPLDPLLEWINSTKDEYLVS